VLCLVPPTPDFIHLYPVRQVVFSPVYRWGFWSFRCSVFHTYWLDWYLFRGSYFLDIQKSKYVSGPLAVALLLCFINMRSFLFEKCLVIQWPCLCRLLWRSLKWLVTVSQCEISWWWLCINDMVSSVLIQAPYTPFLTELMYQNLKLLIDPATVQDKDTLSIHYLMLPRVR
jgi:hypothetical protein